MEPEQLAARQEGVVARWQLLGELGLSVDAALWWARGVRAVFPGVYVTGCGPVTVAQHRRAATLTTPRTWLARDWAAAAYGFRDDAAGPVTVVRPGQGGPALAAGLDVRYSLTLGPNVGTREGLPITSPERTVIDLWPLLRTVAHRHRMVREAIRTDCVTARSLLTAIRAHRGVRGTGELRAFVSRYQHLPLRRCRSDAEAYALTVLHDLGVPIPLVNSRQAGEEADFCWPGPRHILEIDGPGFHLFADVDARKTAAWTRAGFRVERLPSPRLYDDPLSILAVCPGGSPG